MCAKNQSLTTGHLPRWLGIWLMPLWHCSRILIRMTGSTMMLHSWTNNFLMNTTREPRWSSGDSRNDGDEVNLYHYQYIEVLNFYWSWLFLSPIIHTSSYYYASYYSDPYCPYYSWYKFMLIKKLKNIFSFFLISFFRPILSAFFI